MNFIIPNHKHLEVHSTTTNKISMSWIQEVTRISLRIEEDKIIPNHKHPGVHSTTTNKISTSGIQEVT